MRHSIITWCARYSFNSCCYWAKTHLNRKENTLVITQMIKNRYCWKCVQSGTEQNPAGCTAHICKPEWNHLQITQQLVSTSPLKFPLGRLCLLKLTLDGLVGPLLFNNKIWNFRRGLMSSRWERDGVGTKLAFKVFYIYLLHQGILVFWSSSFCISIF